MSREYYICRAIDAPLPDVEIYRSQCLFDWVQAHPSVRDMRHHTRVSSRRSMSDGRQRQVHEIVLTIDYTEGTPTSALDGDPLFGPPG